MCLRRRPGASHACRQQPIRTGAAKLLGKADHATFVPIENRPLDTSAPALGWVRRSLKQYAAEPLLHWAVATDRHHRLMTKHEQCESVHRVAAEGP